MFSTLSSQFLVPEVFGLMTHSICAHCCSEANSAAVAAKGGIEAVVAALRRHEGEADVAEAGCLTLVNIAVLGERLGCVCVAVR